MFRLIFSYQTKKPFSEIWNVYESDFNCWLDPMMWGHRNERFVCPTTRGGKKTNNPGNVLIETFFFTTRRNRSNLRARLSPREITSRHCNFQSRSDVLQQEREDFFPKNLHLGHGNSKQWPLNFHVLASLRWMNAGKKKMKECGSNFPATTYKWDVSSSS